jgi:hypothetical protein
MPVSGYHLASQEPFRVGVSYWPRQSGYDLWKHFDVDEVHEDFSVMADMGLNLARVSLLWEDFQPQPDAVRCAALAHLLELCDAAASEGVRLELLLFAGPAGNPRGYPNWLRQGPLERVEQSAGQTAEQTAEPGAIETCCALLNPFSNPLAKSAAETFVRAIARTVGNHSAIWAYNLGDRPDRLAPSACRIAANAWFDGLRNIIHSVDAKHPVTCSLGGANFSSNATLRVDQVFSVLDHSTIDREGLSIIAGDAEPQALAVFGCALTTALSGKPCLLQSDWDCNLNGTGQAAQAAGQADAAESLLRGLHNVGTLGAIIGTFTDLPGHQSGLLGADGRTRPHATGIQDFVGTRRCVQRPGKSLVALHMSADEFYEHPDANLRRLFSEFMQQQA